VCVPPVQCINFRPNKRTYNEYDNNIMYCLYYIRMFVRVFSSSSSSRNPAGGETAYNGDYTRVQYYGIGYYNRCEGLYYYYEDASGRPVSTNISLYLVDGVIRIIRHVPCVYYIVGTLAMLAKIGIYDRYNNIIIA